MLRSLVLVVLTGLALTACAIPLALPPVRADFGLTQQKGASGARVDIGTSLGSVVPMKQTRLDVGAGFLFDMLTKPDGYMDASARGEYVDAGVAVHRWDIARVLVGGRYESYKGGTYDGAAKLRVDLELLGHVESKFSGAADASGAFGGAYGNAGVGVYAEAGPAWSAQETGWTATVGLSVRLPAWGAIIWGFPHGGSSGGGSHSFGFSGSSGSGSSR